MHHCENFVKIDELLIFKFCKIVAICHLGYVWETFWTTHKEYLVVSINVQNLVVINAVVL